MTNNESQLNRLRNLNIVNIIFIIVAIVSIYLNSLAKKDVINHTDDNKEIIKNIKIILLIVLILCYLYFVYDKNNYRDYSSNNIKYLDIGASTLMIIAVVILIYIESTESGIVDIV